MIYKYKCIALLVNFLTISSAVNAKICRPKIAIIGGGIGGASASHFLTKLFQNNLEIDLFEADTVGGRLATIKIGNNVYESGGTIIHEKNELMKYFIDFLDLQKAPTNDTERVAIWSGDKVVFESSTNSIITLGKLIYRYGIQPFQLHLETNSMLRDFAKIYKLQDGGIGFENVTSLLSSMNEKFPKMLEMSTRDYFNTSGYSSKVIDELIEATIAVNYGQDTDIHSFVGFVSIAGAGSDLWAVKGGNKQVPEKLISENKKVNLIKATVQKVSYFTKNDGTPQYNLFYQKQDNPEIMSKAYDIVIIAAPLTHDYKTLIEFMNLPKAINIEYNNEYQTTIATFIKGKLKSQYFNLVDPIEDILSCDPDQTIINSVGRLISVDGVESNVYKVFSRKPLSMETLHKMFYQVDDVKEKIWQAYPKYSTKPLINKFKLHDGLYYVNAIEWAASAAEMSAIGGRNVAILVYNDHGKNC